MKSSHSATISLMGKRNRSGIASYELLVAALGACPGMTLRMYAERKR
jgi:uncharacterized OsmC-like protein